MYDILLQECVSNDVMCSYLHSLSDLDAHTELQCLYLHKVKECECLAQKLSKQAEIVSKEVYNELLRSFAKLRKPSISLELALQQCQEQMKNDTVYKEKASNLFLKEREQYFEIQDLKAQLQDKNIAISELNKLIKKNKGKGVDTNFEKQSILGKPPLQPIKNQPVVRQPTAYKSERSQLPRHRIASQVGQKFSPNKSSAVYLKTTPLRSGLTWKPTGRIFTQVGVKWISIRKSVETLYNTNDSASPLEKETHNPKTVICANSYSLSAGEYCRKVQTTTTTTASCHAGLGEYWSGVMREISKLFLSVILEKFLHIATKLIFQKYLVPLELQETVEEMKANCEVPLSWNSTKLPVRSAVTSQPLSIGTFLPILVILWKPCQVDSLNLLDHRYKRWCCRLIPTESNSLLHAHTQARKTYYKHQDSRIKKAQELNTKTFANSDIQDLPISYQDYQDNDCQGILLARFQDDA
ncbi:hypothetical protein Tco_0085529 [Tanacetum coccineum]